MLPSVSSSSCRLSFGRLSKIFGHLKLGLFVALLSDKTHSRYKSSIKDVTCTSSRSGVGIPVENQLAINALDYSRALSSTPSVWMPVLLLIWYYLDHDSFGVSLEVEEMLSPPTLFFFRLFWFFRGLYIYM